MNHSMRPFMVVAVLAAMTMTFVVDAIGQPMQCDGPYRLVGETPTSDSRIVLLRLWRYDGTVRVMEYPNSFGLLWVRQWPRVYVCDGHLLPQLPLTP